jgi:protein SCO1/2
MQAPVILNLAYYTCKDICPQVFAGITQALPKLKLTPKKEYAVITVSFDENDTPQIARETKKNYLKAIDTPFPDEAWRFLTGKREQIEALTKSVGFAFRREGHEFIHPVTLIILSPDGTINRYIYVPKSAYGVSYPVNFSALELQTGLTDAAQGKIGAAVKRVFLYCFPHEPKNQAAFFRLLSIVGASTLIGILVLFVILRKTSSKKSPGTTHESK